MSRKKKSAKPAANPSLAAFNQGIQLLRETPPFNYMASYVYYVPRERPDWPRDSMAIISNDGIVYVNLSVRAEPKEWLYVLAHCLLHLAFEHFQRYDRPEVWNIACDCFVARFLHSMKIGTVPVICREEIPGFEGTEGALYRRLCDLREIPPEYHGFGTASSLRDMVFETNSPRYKSNVWRRLFADGVAYAATAAVCQTSNSNTNLDQSRLYSRASRGAREAMRWFVSHYPLLGALAAEFAVIEDNLVCVRADIRIAAVSPELKEIYINPSIRMRADEYVFVLAHELLHVGLSHHGRSQGRDPFLWNVACDYVINGWLVEMGIGRMPVGTLHDPELAGLGAEAIYDRIVVERRLRRKLATYRGYGSGDILEGSSPNWWAHAAGVTLDEFFRRALAQGLDYHNEGSRGLLPAGLVEEIRSLSQPPIPWDVKLARWFDERFPVQEKRQTYARLSRRQSATPDIPRPNWTRPEDELRTFAVILDTSGSMDRHLLAKALGTIASYGMSRDVPMVRVLFCDARVYDQGYMSPDEIAGRVEVRGRGGTVLQPAIDLIEHDNQFPGDGPILIITDGYCDRLKLHRDHAFVIPRGHSLPFVPVGQVFYIE